MYFLLLLSLFVAGVTTSAQTFNHVDMGSTFAHHPKKIFASLGRILSSDRQEVVTSVLTNYTPEMGTLQEVANKILGGFAEKFTPKQGDENASFYFAFQASADLGTNRTSSRAIATIDYSPWKLDSKLQIPQEAQSWPLRPSPWVPYWLPQVTGVDFIPTKNGREVLEGKIVTPNGVDNPECSLIKNVGNGVVYLFETYVYPGSEPWHIVFHTKDGDVVIDNQTGDQIIQEAPSLSMLVSKDEVTLSVRGSGNVRLECSTNLTDWYPCAEMLAPGEYSDTREPGKLRFYRVRQVGTLQSIQ